ncbi:MAG: hypothetical protein CMF22_10315 [Idiomarinaceae bacterium]|nr:hypothetical protein [Idiomarinaceae bacterium]MBG23834.1 hypothetical protein [Idiomarinaceae bacterium]|tara:strand:+ start:27795 stop:28133 length:339 start_codon:yes stop_codon:yes gene_type:complete
MHINVTETMFIEQFRMMDRMDNFSIDGLKALFEHLEEMEESSGQRIECDVIALCCDFTEDTIDDIIANYGIDIIEDNGPIDYEEVVEQVIEYLQDNTMVIYHDNEKVLFQVF